MNGRLLWNLERLSRADRAAADAVGCFELGDCGAVALGDCSEGVALLHSVAAAGGLARGGRFWLGAAALG